MAEQTGLLVWDMRRRVHVERLPDRRVVAQFDFSGTSNETLRLILEKPHPSACDFDPGFDVDVYVEADALELTWVWTGLRSWKAAMGDGKVQFSGTTEYTREFPDWFQLNFFSGIPDGRMLQHRTASRPQGGNRGKPARSKTGGRQMTTADAPGGGWCRHGGPPLSGTIVRTPREMGMSLPALSVITV